jgi:tetratricopeptide (TPR) repeat protein
MSALARELPEGYQPSRADELNAQGAEFYKAGHIEPARVHFLAALALNPKHAQALQNLGAVLRSMHHHEASATLAFKSVIVTEGKDPFCKANLGVALLSMRRHLDALKVLKETTQELPHVSFSWHNYGLVLYVMGRYDEAIEAFDKGISLGPTPNMYSDRALALLSQGRIQEGLAQYEVRWEILRRSHIWSLGIPEWQGQQLDGRSVLVHHEQGYGDSIMLVRFVRDLLALRANVTLAVPPELVELFANSFSTVRVIDWLDEAAIKASVYDFHTPMLSLMRWVGIRSPQGITSTPYLVAEPKAPMKLTDAKVRIGICWASGNHSPDMVERRRVAPVTHFLRLLHDPDVALISLQKGEDAKDIARNGLEGLVFDPSHRLETFADTASLIQCLDLVISVDSAVAHLAGALGKPTIMLSPFTRCWRWWGNGLGWPWYNRMKVYSQEANGSWKKAVDSAIATRAKMLS